MNTVYNLPFEDMSPTNPWQSPAAIANVSDVISLRGCNPIRQERVDLTQDVYNTLDTKSSLACFDQLGKPPPIPNLLSNDFQQQLPITCEDMLPYMLAGLRFKFDLSMGVSNPHVLSTFDSDIIHFMANGNYYTTNGSSGTWEWTRDYNFKYGQLVLVSQQRTVRFDLIAQVQYAGNHTSNLGAGTFWFSPVGASLST